MARKEQREMGAERPPMSTGVGESKIFIAEDTADDTSNPRHPANCTLNGQPVPEHLWGMIPYEMTDQGYAEKHEGKEHARASVTVDEVHRKIQRRGGDLDRGMEPFDAFDPMKELVREYVPAGMRPKFLSDRKMQAEGTTRGYVICKDANGSPVRFGTNILGYMPEERAQAIQQAFEQKSADAQREMYGEDFDPRNPGRERVSEKVMKHEGGRGSGRLSGGSIATFENPGPQGSDLGLQGSDGGDFNY